MDTLIAVISYNDVANTTATVESLLGQGRVVVWDNNSPDRTADILAEKDLPIEIYPSIYNILWTPACNAAVETYLRDEQYILFSNNDIVYRPGVVERLKAELDNGYDIVGPTGTCLGGLQDYATHWGKGRPATNVDHLPTVRTTYLVGASMMMRRDVYEAVGPLCDRMPLGADDHDYCIRAKELGYKIGVVNSAYVNHKGHATGKHSPAIWKENAGESWKVFNEKWAGYYLNEEEAIKCHWGAVYHPGWDVGTGWKEPDEQAKAWESRGFASVPT